MDNGQEQESYTVHLDNGMYSIVNHAAHIWLTFTTNDIGQTITFGNTNGDEVVIQSYPEFMSYAEQIIGNNAVINFSVP